MVKEMLYVSDMDGTLLDANVTVSDESVRLLNEAIASGANFTVATARTAATVSRLLEKVDMDIPAIVMTGAAWWHFDSRRYSHCRFIKPERVRLFVTLFETYGISPFIYVLPEEGEQRRLKVFYDNKTPSAPDMAFIDQRKDLPLKEMVLNTGLPPTYDSRVILFFASGPKDILQKIADEVLKLTPCSVSCYDDIYNPGTGLIEIFAAGVSKASAILELKQHLGVKQITVFGDNLNDIPMFEVADTAVAVDNASQTVKEKADVVTGSNNENSVAKYVLDSIDNRRV